jgi:hypothetical protein
MKTWSQDESDGKELVVLRRSIQQWLKTWNENHEMKAMVGNTIIA